MPVSQIRRLSESECLSWSTVCLCVCRFPEDPQVQPVLGAREGTWDPQRRRVDCALLCDVRSLSISGSWRLGVPGSRSPWRLRVE